MTVTVEPIRSEERPRCQFCGKGLQPDFHCRKRLSTMDGVKDPEAALAAFSTNRRVVRVVRKWYTYQPAGIDQDVVRSLNAIEVVFMPESMADWDAYDGLFCTLNCSRRFARAAHKAGYRMPTKS
jgi:hypothetical protein